MADAGHSNALSLLGLVPGYGRMGGLTPPIQAAFEGAGIHAIIGRNGQGKSTLIRTMAGLQRPLAGRVELGGVPLHAMTVPHRAARMAFVDSTPPRGSGLTVGEVLMLARPDAMESACRAWLERIGASNWWSARIAELSDGQAQRVMVARAALQETQWLILDEPTAFLDVPAREDLMEMLGEMAAMGLALMLATHDLHLLKNNAQLRSLHLMNSDGLQVLSTASSVKEWENELRNACSPENNSTLK